MLSWSKVCWHGDLVHELSIALPNSQKSGQVSHWLCPDPLLHVGEPLYNGNYEIILIASNHCGVAS